MFKDQRGDRPDKPYGTIKILSGPKVLGHDEIRPPDEGMTDDFLIAGQRRFLVEFEIFSSLDNLNAGPIDPNQGAIQLMSNVRDAFERPTLYNLLNGQGISVNDKQDIQNLSEILEDVFEERAVLTVTLGYGSNVGDSPGIIEKVGVGGTVEDVDGTTTVTIPQAYIPAS